MTFCQQINHPSQPSELRLRLFVTVANRCAQRQIPAQVTNLVTSRHFLTLPLRTTHGPRHFAFLFLQSRIIQRHTLSVRPPIAILRVPQYYNLRTTLILSYLTQKGENITNITIFRIQQSKILLVTTHKMLKHNYLSQLLKNHTTIYKIQPK